MAYRAGVDPAMVGATRAVYSPLSGRTFVAGGWSSTIQVFTGSASAAFALVGESASLTIPPTALAYSGSALYAMTETAIYALTDAAIPAVTLTIANDAFQNAMWIAIYGNIIVAPSRHGIMTWNKATGVEIDRLESQSSRATVGVFNSATGRLYLLDEMRATGCALTVSTAGLLSDPGASFAIPNGQDIRGAIVDGTTLFIATDARVLTFSLADPDAPVFVSSTTYATSILDIVSLSGGKYWLACDPMISAQAMPVPWSASTGLVANSSLCSVHGHDSALLGLNPATAADGTPAPLPNLSALNALSFNGTVRALLVVGTTLYIGGDFTTVTDATGAQARTRLCAVSAITGLLTSWAPACDGGVYALCTDGTNIYVGGLFNNAGGSGRVNLAAFVLGGALIAWNPGTDNGVQALAHLGGVIYVGGQFSTLAATGRNFAGAVSTAGVLQAWAPDPNATVYCIAISGTNIYLGGGFSLLKAGTINRSRGCVTDPAGVIGTWNAQANSGYIYGMQIVGALVYVAGSFSAINGTPRFYAAVIDTSNVLQAQNPTGDNIAQAVAVDSALNFYVGGSFTTLQTVARRFAGSVDPSNTLRSWNPGLTGGTVVYALAVYGPALVLGGTFSNPAGGANIYVLSAP